MLIRRTICGPSTAAFQIEVRTVLPSHATSRGRPTFTETSFIAPRHHSPRAASRGMRDVPIDRVVDQRLHEDIRVTVNLPPRDARARLRDFDATVVALLDAAVVLRPVDIDFELI